MTSKTPFTRWGILFSCIGILTGLVILVFFLSDTLTAGYAVLRARELKSLGTLESAEELKVLTDRTYRLIVTLQTRNTEASARELAKLLEYPDPWLCALAQSRLSQFDLPEVRDAVLKRLDDNVKFVQMQAIGNLGHLREKRAVPRLLELIDDPSPDIQVACALALGRIGDTRAFEPLVRQLASESTEPRNAAAKGLSLLGDRRAIAPLKRLVATEQVVYIRSIAKACLFALGDTTYEQELLTMMGPRSDKRSVGIWVAGVFMRLGRVEGAQRLLDYLLQKIPAQACYLLWCDYAKGVPRINFRSKDLFPGEYRMVAEWIVANTFDGRLRMPPPD